MFNAVVYAFVATVGTWFLTALGAATVFLIKKPSEKFLNLMLGFSAGVMIAASFWSLLQPAISRAEECSHLPSYIVVSSGFLFGSVFMWLSDRLVTYARYKANLNYESRNNNLNRIILLVLSITIHNIPEGLAVGVAFGLLNKNYTTEGLLNAVSIAIGIGLQNFPEGTAVSLPLRREGYSRRKSFLIGQASALVEPLAAVTGALLVTSVEVILPYALSFAAGTMILVAVHELIPECQQNQNKRSYNATIGIICGFISMMILDVMLG